MRDPAVFASCSGEVVELGVHEEVHLIGRHPQHRFLAGDELLGGHVHRDAHGRLGGALAVAGLQHPQLALFDRELDVLHVPVVQLEPLGDVQELGVGLGHLLAQLVDLLGHADAGHHVLALGVGEVVALDVMLAGGAVAGHGDPGGAGLAHVAEHHGHDADGGPQIVGDPGGIAVVHGALAVPAFENRGGRHPQLLVGLGGEIAVGHAPEDLLELRDDRLEFLGGELGVDLDVGLAPGPGEHLFERLVREPHHDTAEHLDQPAVGIEDEARVGGERDHALGGVLVQADVEHRVHHARHGELRARAAGDKQRVVRIAELPAAQRLDLLQAGDRLFPHAGGEGAAVGEVLVASLGADGEARRYRHPDAHHLGQVRPLAAEQPAHRIP